MAEQNKKQAPRTTLIYRGKTYPFYITNRGRYDFENSGHSVEDLRTGSTGAMLAQIYYQLKDCAKRNALEIADTFEEFIDNSDSDIFNVFVNLKEESEKDSEAKKV